MNAARRVEIAGGGLAGLSLGHALVRAGVPVTITEAGRYPRHRVCGEFIAGLSASTVAHLGLGPHLADAGRLTAVQFVRHGRPVRQLLLPRPALAISRHRLDERLAAAFVGAGGRLVCDTRVEEAAGAEGRVWASGRLRSASDWLGIKAHVRGLALAADLEVHLGRGAYAGASAVEDGWINVCGLFRRRPGLGTDRATALVAHLRAAGLGELADRVMGGEIDPGSCTAVAGLGYGRPVPARPGEIHLGDASGLIPPFTGNGMAMAFQSAELAVEPLTAWSRGSLSWVDASAQVTARLRNRFRRRLTLAGALHPFLYTSLGQFGLASAARLGLLPMRSLYLATH